MARRRRARRLRWAKRAERTERYVGEWRVRRQRRLDRSGTNGATGGGGGSTGGTSPGAGGSSAGGTGGMGGASEVVCVYGDQVYRPGDSFRAIDDCNTCYCANDGTIGCTLIDCAGSGGSSGTAGAATGGTSGTGGVGGTGAAAGQGGATSCTEPPIGQICLRGRQTRDGETLSAGDELRIELRPLGCYSSSCTEIVRSDCAIQTIEGGYSVTGGLCLATTGDSECTGDCGGGGVAECTSEPLVDGDYWLTLEDGFQLQFTVPSTFDSGGRCESLVIIGLPAR